MTLFIEDKKIRLGERVKKEHFCNVLKLDDCMNCELSQDGFECGKQFEIGFAFGYAKALEELNKKKI